MKWLILVRHAKSSWKEALPDLQRPLNKRGRRNAPMMAERLAGRLRDAGRTVDLLISSPAERAMSTARIFASELQIPDRQILVDADLYHAACPHMLERITRFDDALDTVVWFGHNPDLTELVDRLADAGIDNVPTGGMCCIEFPCASWREVRTDAGELQWFDYPKRDCGEPAGKA